MTTQPSLFRPPNPVPHPESWKPNQQTAWALITATPGGCFAEEIGHKIHGHQGEGTCEWCGPCGTALCKSKALKGHVIRRKKTGKWEARDARYRAVEPSAQLSELPSDFFGAAA